MNTVRRLLISVLLLGTFAIPVAVTGCAGHTYYRAYDPYYRDYHTWPDEDAYYRRWYTDNYRDRQYREYRRLNKDEQKRYWDWRHGQHEEHHEEHH